MPFDSHVTVRLEDAASLVNALTSGAARGKPYPAPTGAQLPEAIAAALPYLRERMIDADQAGYLVRTAQQLRLAFEAASAGHLDDAAATVNALLLATGARPHLRRDPDEPWRLHFHGADDSLAVSTSASCATGLALALGSDMSDRLGVCQAARCDRVYVDTSRNAARHFCSTACQNRTKAAAFRARRGAGES
ncbi:CGNR zinc finger domain-containing protein [Streptomyces sp. NPDC004111]|uniref:CGNR zinc finger domain-containing protein n=1 Tax=Streptomyces sp. NPDC004111 TaxID=3364690 RepID=UPI0036BFAE3A